MCLLTTNTFVKKLHAYVERKYCRTCHLQDFAITLYLLWLCSADYTFCLFMGDTNHRLLVY